MGEPLRHRQTKGAANRHARPTATAPHSDSTDFVEKLGIARVRGRGFTLVFGGAGVKSMMGERRVGQEALFYEFSLERHVPETHLLRSIDRFVELDGLRPELVPFYSEKVRPSIDPELMIRMLIVGYCFGIRSERRLCEEVHLNLAYRWFCRLGLDGDVPDHSTFSKNRHGRFRESDLLRRLFETDCTAVSTRGWSAAKALPSTPV
jgi:transposase